MHWLHSKPTGARKGGACPGRAPTATLAGALAARLRSWHSPAISDHCTSNSNGMRHAHRGSVKPTAKQLALRLAELQAHVPRSETRGLGRAVERARVAVATHASEGENTLASFQRFLYVANWTERAWWALLSRSDIAAEAQAVVPIAEALNEVREHWLVAESERIGIAVPASLGAVGSRIGIRELLCTALEGALAMRPRYPVLVGGLSCADGVAVEVYDHAGSADQRWERRLEWSLLAAVARFIGASISRTAHRGRGRTTIVLPATSGQVLQLPTLPPRGSSARRGASRVAPRQSPGARGRQ